MDLVLALPYHQVYDPFSHSLALTSIFAALPLITLFVLLGGFRMPAQWAALISLAVSIIIAVAVYPMPVGQAFDAAAEGAAFGLFPIMWIVVNAIWIYNMTVTTGHFDVLRRSFARISDDQRVQAIIIAFCFGALLEALAGFGTPVAITSVMLIALGFRPLKAATVALVANTAPVAFGALAVPIVTLGKVSGISSDTIGATVGRQTPILSVFVPLALVAIVDKGRGVRRTWPACLVAGGAFGLAQWLCSNYISVLLTDIVASLFATLVLVLFLRVWQPSETYVERGDEAAEQRVGPVPTRRVRPVAGGASDQPGEGFARRVRADEAAADPRGEVARAYAPYVIIIVVFVLATLVPAIKTALDAPTKTFGWPGLDLVSGKGKPLSLVQYKFNWLSAAGTLLLISGLLAMPVLRISVGRALRAYGETLGQLKWAIVTVAAVLALAFVMNAAGQTTTLGMWMAGAGGIFAVISPILGWIGVAVTGSDTSSNSLFGALQVTAAKGSGLSPVLLASANSSGGVLGKMISPQNLAIAASAVGLAGREGDIFRRVFGWSLLFLAGMCVLVWLQSNVLSAMIPTG